MDADLPFYYYILNERYHLEEPGFDEAPNRDGDHVYGRGKGGLRLHTVTRNTREDNAIMTAGRPQMPGRNSKSIRHRLFAPEAGLPPVPEELLL